MTVVELRQKRGNLVEQMRALVTKASGRAMTTEESEAWAKLDADQGDLASQIQREERQVALDSEMREAVPPVAGGRQETPPDASGETRITATPEYLRAFRSWAVGGIGALGEADRAVLQKGYQRALATAPDSAGGYTIPEGFSNRLEEALKAIGGVRQAATILPTDSGNDLPWPTTNDTANEGEILAENTPANEQDVAFSVVIFKAFKYSSKMVRVSFELLQDSAFNLDTWLPDVLAERIGRITNRHFTLGTATTQPQGVVVGATDSGIVVAAAGPTYAQLVDFVHTVDPAYRIGPKVGFMFHDTTLAYLKKMVDGQQRPIWQPGLVEGQPDRILGYQYWINQHMDAVGVSKTPMLFGDFSKYVIRDVKAITLLRLVERYAEYHQVAFLSWSRHDGRLLDAGTHPIKKMVQGATLLAATAEGAGDVPHAATTHHEEGHGKAKK